MEYIVIGRDYAEAHERRAHARARHLELGDRMVDEGTLLYAAALLDESGEMCGSVIVCRFSSRAELDEWLLREPYVTERVWETVEVTPCRSGPRFT